MTISKHVLALGLLFLPLFATRADAPKLQEYVEVTSQGGGWSITLRVPKVVRDGGPVPLKFVLKNEGDAPVTLYCFAYQDCLPESCTATLVHLGTNQPCEFTERGRNLLGDGPRMGSGGFFILKAKEERTFTSDLSRVFNLEAAEYELSLIAELHTNEGRNAKIAVAPLRFRYFPKAAK